MTGAMGMPVVPDAYRHGYERHPIRSIHPRWCQLSCVNSPSFGQSINQSIDLRHSLQSINQSINQSNTWLTPRASASRPPSCSHKQIKPQVLNISWSSPIVNMSRPPQVETWCPRSVLRGATVPYTRVHSPCMKPAQQASWRHLAAGALMVEWQNRRGVTSKNWWTDRPSW